MILRSASSRLLVEAVAVPVLSALALGGCSLAFEGADQAGAYGTTREAVGAIQVPDGFRAVLVVEGLDFPSSMTWDDQGRLYVLESHTVPVPMLKRQDPRRSPRATWRRSRSPDPRRRRARPPWGSPSTTAGSTSRTRRRTAASASAGCGPEGGEVEAVVRGLPAEGRPRRQLPGLRPRTARSTSGSAARPTPASSPPTTRSTRSGSPSTPRRATSPAATWS